MLSAVLTSKIITVTGIVQGVGFRPFVYNNALKYHLLGDVANTGDGVIIHLEGESSALDAFLNVLKNHAPKLSRIDNISIVEQLIQNYSSFEILQSHSQSKTTSVSPDVGICDACLSELRSSDNRRSRYFLINCTQCGPRYSIIQTLPYDRVNTSMQFFTMCQACEDEYRNPLDRRYHAQPVSCYDCGPKLQLYNSDQTLIHEGSEAVAAVAALLDQGGIIAVKGIGGFHLMCDASNEQAVATLRERKKRPKKPFAVMFPDLLRVEKNVTCNALEKGLLHSKERPIVLLTRVKDNHIADNVAPDINRLGVMLPYTPLHYLLFEHFNRPVVATSANRSNEPIYRSYAQIDDNLNDVVDAVLDIDRDIVNAVDDSVVQVVEGHIQIMRLGRGFAPLNMPLPFKSHQKILAVGAQQKSAIALSFDGNAILSPHIGDLGSIEAFEFFERTVSTFKRFYEFEPDLLVCDKHPQYMSSEWAQKQPKELILVQHHYAHALACMLEHRLDETVLAFSFDGSGYGDDGTIWGGEVMLCDNREFERVGHLVPFRLLGGEKAVKEPRRMALSILFECYGHKILDECHLPLLSEFTPQEIALLYQAWEKGINTPIASSMGRLFDAIASLMGLLHVSQYEGQSGLLIEALCHDEHAKIFEYTIDEGIIDISAMIRQIVTLLIDSNPDEIADRFINTLVAIIDEFADKYPQLPLLFSGGVFQNKTLLSRTLKHFKAKKRRCYVPELAPINDGAIALGQLAFALYQDKG
ncbi:MAG: carbamoyltransferase HypF [Campylobacterota bacterium]|nr:carbamoyltransferase HypF [Campylobacterota bacterium]